MTYVTLQTKKEGYSTAQCGSTMTVQEMIDCLPEFDPEAKIYFSNDNGYPYGSIHDYLFYEGYEEDENEE